MIRLQNVSVSFDKKLVLDKLSVNFEHGKKYAVMGESGCGKTTILNLIAGLLKPTSGTVETDDQRISYVFQEPRLFGWMSVLDNVTLVIDASEKDRGQKAKDILCCLGLGDSLSLYPYELSGGMKQRVSLARALAYSPDVILLDEPFKALDETTRKKVCEYIFEEMSGKTVIIVTHDIEDTLYTDYTIKLNTFPVSQIDMAKSSSTDAE